MKKDLPVYQITIEDPNAEEDLGIEQIAFVKNPAIIVKGIAFSSHKVRLSTDNVKMRIAAPALIPGEVYRNDEDGEYYVEFTEDEIEVIYKDFMSKLSQKKDVFNIEHTDKVIPAYVLESMLIDSDNKVEFIKNEYGIDLPKGSMFIVSQITDEEYYNKLVKEDRIGMSIEGFLSLKLSEIINKKEEQMKKQNFMLPDGEWEIEGKIYVIKDGEVLEIRDKAPEVEIEAQEAEKKEEEVAMQTEEELPVEEVAAQEEIVEEEEVVEEEVSLVTKEEVMKFVEEIIDEKLAGVSDMIAEMKVKMEALEPNAEEEKVEMTKLSAAEVRVQKALAFAKAFGR